MLQKRIPTAILVAFAAGTTAALAISIKPKPEAPSATPAETASAPAAAASHSPSEVDSNGGSLSMSAELSQNVVTHDTTTMWLQVKLNAAKVEGGERPPLDVALVIDCSGSMGGEKIEQARAAARQLVARLGPDDRMSIVKFDSSPILAAPLVAADETATLVAAIENMHAGGGTSIYDGYRMGLSTLVEAPRSASRVVFLLSDGLGSRSARALGDATADGLSHHDTAVTTLGIGDDFDEQRLGAMAVRGGGKFYYVETPQKLREHLNAEWRGLATAAARGVQVQLTPGAGVRVQDVLGYETQEADGSTIVRLDSIFSERSRQIIIELAIDPAQVTEGLVDVVLNYEDVSQIPAAQIMAQTRAAAPSVDRSLGEHDENGHVLSRVRRVKTAMAVDEVDRLLTAGRRDEARKVIDHTRRANATFMAHHGSTEELEKANTAIERSILDLDRPIQEKRQIRIRKKRKQATIEIISGDRR